MKKIFPLVLIVAPFNIVACSTEEDPTPSGPTYNALNSYSAKMMGAQNNASLGSFYSSSEDSIYFTARATEKSDKVDLIYYFGSQTGDSSVIAAASDPVFNNPNDQNPHVAVKTWTTKNDTKFKVLTISANQFNNMINDSLLIAELDSGLNSTKATKLMVGSIVGFKTAAGKLGAFQVSAITNATVVTRSITMNVKVQ